MDFEIEIVEEEDTTVDEVVLDIDYLIDVEEKKNSCKELWEQAAGLIRSGRRKEALYVLDECTRIQHSITESLIRGF